MADFPEKRRFPRLSMLAEVTYKRSSIPDEEKIALSKDISACGICFIAYEKFNKDEILDLNIFIIEDKKPITVIGRVVWSREFVIGEPKKGSRYDVGFEFLKISPEDSERIKKYVIDISSLRVSDKAEENKIL